MTKKSKEQFRGFRFEPMGWFSIVVGIIASVLTIFVDHEHSTFYISISIFMLNCGIMEMILGVNGRRSNYIFALMNTIASIFITWIDQFYGNMIISVYYIAICIVGFYSWGKHSDKNKDVIARKLSTKQIIIAAIVFVIAFFGLNLLLEHYNGHSTMLDSATTILIIYASVLGVLRYREQWIIWIVADFLMLLMWITSNNPAIIVTRAFYVLGSIYGYFNWRKFIKYI